MKNINLPASYILPIIMLLIIGKTTAQNTTYNKGRIFTADAQKTEFTTFHFGEDMHEYQTYMNGPTKTISPDQIIKIEEQAGTEAGKWALWLGLGGLVGSALGVASAKANAEADGFDTSDVNGVPVILSLTALSAGIGALIGSSKKTYKTVYSNPAYGAAPRPQIDLAVQGKGAALLLTFSF